MMRSNDGEKISVGRCRRCQVEFVSQPSDRLLTMSLLEVHAAICPGGMRATERVEPAAARSLLRSEMLASA
ncbi:MAG: hypothetical protein KIT14_22320 [bacterium]|nr:hypothetical protein [bacterium]